MTALWQTRSTRSTRIARAVFVALLLVVSGLGLRAADAPTLTELDRLKVTNALLVVELARLKADQARTDYSRAVDEARALVATLQHEGYTLDLQTLTYRQIGKEPQP